LSAQGISPQDVDDAAVEAFQQALGEEYITVKPGTAAQSAVRLWNRMIQQVPGWPQRRLTPLRKRETYTVSWTALAPELVQEIDAYLAVLGGDDPTDDRAPPRPLKKLSLAKRRYELLQHISALHHKGIAIAELRSLHNLCKLDLMKIALQFYCDRHRNKHGDGADARESTMIGGIADSIRILAKHYVQTLPEVLRELTRLANRFKRRSNGMAEKNRQRLGQLHCDTLMYRLLSHSLSEMQKLAKRGRVSRLDAVRYSTLPAIEILINAPMRIGNLAHLDLETHFRWPHRGRGDTTILIARHEVKNAQPLQYKIPDGPTAAAFRIYLERFRPLLLSGYATALSSQGAATRLQSGAIASRKHCEAHPYRGGHRLASAPLPTSCGKALSANTSRRLRRSAPVAGTRVWRDDLQDIRRHGDATCR
jgi:hypothetical protein